MRYPLSSPDSICPEALDAAVQVLRSGHFTMGAHVAAFETAFARYVGTTHAVMVNSGSSANLLAVEAMLRPSNGKPRWKAGDEVLVPALAWSTTVAPLIQLGLVPVFVDVDPETLAMDFTQVRSLITDKTVGLMLIHVLGLAADLTEATRICNSFSTVATHGQPLTLIEDCCESMGARFNGQHVGTVGAIGTFSHFFSHQLTTMEGGTVVTNDDAIADDLRSMRAHGWSRNRTDKATWEAGKIDPHFLFVTTGYNVRPMEVQGAMGLEQLKRFDDSLMDRWGAVLDVRNQLRHIPGLTMLGWKTWGHKEADERPLLNHTWMNIPILTEPGQRDAVVRVFHACGIETRPILAGNLLKHPALRGANIRRQFAYPVADRVMRDGFMIGCHPHPELEGALADVVKALRVAA